MTLSNSGNVRTLTLSDDFKAPDAPDPHWQVVDSRGNVFMLHKLKIKEDRINTRIALPGYVSDVAKANLLAAHGKLSDRVLNVATGFCATTFQIAEQIYSADGKTVPVSRTGPRPGDLERSVLDPTRVIAALGTAPVPLDRGLTSTGERQSTR